ncbi:MAG: DUF362 domain-containing protein [Candidatus Cloacimonetes bacterium]|nr:DUF362 domain-containing protein [Candidatus Cloacimonadota bacterium]
MTKVFFYGTKTSDFLEIGAIARSLLEKIVDENDFKFDNNVPLKVHFGEEGNVTYVPAIAYDAIIDYLESKNVNTSFIETNVLYRGQRTTKTLHLKLAHNHGFTRVPIVIADGETGESYYEAEINKEYLKKCKLGLEFQNYNQFVICSHFKGHVLAGFGGALKNLCMGFAARGGKMEQHSQTLPTVLESKCINCGVCAEHCDADAIKLFKKAYIDKQLCIGCAKCIAVCVTGAIYHDWNSDHFFEKMAEYAFAATLGKKNIYINFVLNITKDCDCFSSKMDFEAENVGIFASLDPVALDTACLDVLQKNSKSKIFDKGRKILTHAEKIGVGNMKYVLV